MTRLTASDLASLTQSTLDHYEKTARSFRDGAWDHDVSQNRAALVAALAQEKAPPFVLLDFGCGPGRDLLQFKAEGHDVVGLDGCARFVEMAREATGCDVLHQSFAALDLPRARFDGVFANASLQHVPRQELPRVLSQLHTCLRAGGVLFCSNPHGDDSEGYHGERYSAFLRPETWRDVVTNAGFDELSHYYRPAGMPRERQPWLATVWRKRGG